MFAGDKGPSTQHTCGHAPNLTFPMLGRGAASRASEPCLFVTKVRAFNAQVISSLYFHITLLISVSNRSTAISV